MVHVMMSQVYANIPQYTFEDYQGQDIRHEKVLILRLIFRIRKGAAKRGQHQCQGQNPEQEEVLMSKPRSRTRSATHQGQDPEQGGMLSMLRLRFRTSGAANVKAKI
jgi:hypothetical protein